MGRRRVSSERRRSSFILLPSKFLCDTAALQYCSGMELQYNTLFIEFEQ